MTPKKKPAALESTAGQSRHEPTTARVGEIVADTQQGGKPMLVIDGVMIRRDTAGRYCLNDLHKAAMAAGKATESQRPGEFIRAEGVQRFVGALDARQQTAGNPALSAVAIKTGRNGGTYAAELVAIRYAAWIDADFEVGVYLTFQDATRSRDTWTRERARLAAAHSVMSDILQDKRAEAGKDTEAHHYANEAKLINWALCGEFIGLNRDTMSRHDLALLTFLEQRNAVLIGRDLTYDQRKPMLKQAAIDWQTAWTHKRAQLAINGEAA